MRPLLGAMVFALGCGPNAAAVLASSVRQAPPDIQADCKLVATRCARCHSLDRVIEAQFASPASVAGYVRWMRLRPQSGIPPHEELPMVRCLVYRDFGAAGLAAMEPPP